MSERTAQHLAACPAKRAGLPCPGIDATYRGYAHARFCELLDADPAIWGPTILEEAQVDEARFKGEEIERLADRERRAAARKVRDASYRPWQKGSSIKLGLAVPALNNIGGTESWLLELIRATSDEPFSWAGVACLDPAGALAPLAANVESLAPLAYGQGAVRQLAKRADLVITWGVENLHQYTAEARCRTLLVSHNDPSCNWTVRSLADAELATSCVGVCKAACGAFPRGERERCSVVYNTASLPPATRGRAEQRALWGAPAGAKVVGFLGRVATQKYPDGFAAAIAALPDDYYGVLVGRVTEPLVEQRIRELGCPRVILAGPTDRPENALAAFDMLLMPSRWEAMSISLLESMLAGVPVLTTAIAFMAEHPELARIVPYEADGATLAAAVLADVADSAGTAARVAAAREFVRSELSFERFRAGWRAVLLETMERTAPGVARSYPSPWQQARSAAASAVRAASNGFAGVDGAVRAERLAICEGCPDYDRSSQRCRRCGCYTQLKLSLAAEACPIGKWGAVAS